MSRLLVNDCLTTIPGTKTFWHDLLEWLKMEFIGGDYTALADTAKKAAQDADLVIRNASWFPPIDVSTPTISLLQDIFPDGSDGRRSQFEVLEKSTAHVFNSSFTACSYTPHPMDESNTPLVPHKIIPLPVDFSLFEPGSRMGHQQAAGLPDGCVLWIGAQSEIKGFDIFMSIVRQNPDIHFVGVFKDEMPYCPPNLRAYKRLSHIDLIKIINACCVGLCTSRQETQHLAGIEMGACGLPMVAPPVGVYWGRDDLPGFLKQDDEHSNWAVGIREMLNNPGDPQQIRSYWKKEFDKPVIRAQWESLVEEVECSGRS